MLRRSTNSILLALVFAAALTAIPRPASADASPPPVLELRDGHLQLTEARLSAEWDVSGGKIKPVTLTNVSEHRTCNLAGSALFTVQLGGGGPTIDSSTLTLVGPVAVAPLPAKPDAQCLAERIAGWTATATLLQPGTDSRFDWQLTARTGQNYFRQQLTVHAGKTDLPVARVQLIDWPLDGAQVDGVTPGSPIVSGTLFCGVEHPNAAGDVLTGRARSALERTVPVTPEQPLTVSAVVGVASAGQLRRDFQAYLNQERPPPVRHLPPLQQLVRPGQLHPLRRAGRLGRHQHRRRRNGRQTRRHAQLFPVRRRVG